MTKANKKSDNDSFSFDDLNEVHDNIQDESPEPKQSAIEAAQAVEVETLREQSDNVDSEGTVFNPELHATDKDGNPSVTPLGKFRKKRGASKVSTVSNAQEQQDKINNAKAAASAAVDMSLQSLELLLGPEWKPIQQDGIDERANLKAATANYFIAKDINDFPPGVALTVVVMAYAMPRVTTGKETKTRLAKAKVWAAEKLNNLKRKRKDASQSNSRDDGKRKNDASKETMRNEPPEATRHPRT